MKKLLLIFTTILPISIFAQVSMTEATLYNATIQLNSNGVMFNDFASSMPGYEVPINSGNLTVFDAAVWISGLDQDNNLHTAAITHCQNNSNGFCEYFPGPLKTDGSASTTAETQAEYNRFWFITREMVETHQAYFDCVNDPDCDTSVEFPGGYSIPDNIMDWPASGNTDAGYAENLAPYADYNSNGIYDPTNGDYPIFTGDEAYYTISNDNAGNHMNSQGTPLGVEIHTLFYYYLDSDPALRATMFVHQDFINRSDTNYHDMYLSIWNDFDLGNPSDDYIGTDVAHAYVYAMNSDGFDEASTSGPGYGDDLPMMACKIIAGPYLDPNGEDDLGPFDGNQEYGDYAKGWNDGIIDNERMGLSSSVSMDNGSSPTGDPGIAIEFYNYMRSMWRNGVPVTFGGNGYNPTTDDALPAKYMYPGESDPIFAGTDGVDPGYGFSGGWTEANENHPGGDRRITANCGPFTLSAGQTQSLDYVYVFARQSDDPDTDVHDLLTSYVSAAADRPDSLPTSVISAVEKVAPEQIGFEIFPNPASGEIVIALPGNTNSNYLIYNVLGNIILDGKLQTEQTTVDISRLDPGLYLINITRNGITATRKLVVK